MMQPATMSQVEDIKDIRDAKNDIEDSADAISDSLDVVLDIYEQADPASALFRLAGGSGASGHPCGQGVLGVVRAQGL